MLSRQAGAVAGAVVRVRSVLGAAMVSWSFSRPYSSPWYVSTRLGPGLGRLLTGAFRVQPSWIVAFVGCVFAHLRSNDENRPNNNANPDFPNFVWWTMVFMFFCILGVTVAGLSGRRTFNMAVRRSASVPAGADLDGLTG